MAVDSRWRLYYNDAWVAAHTVEENAAVLDPRGQPSAARARGAQSRRRPSRTTRSGTPPPIVKSTTISSRKGCPSPTIRRSPASSDSRTGENAETYYRQLLKPASGRPSRHVDGEGHPPAVAHDCGSGAHGERRPWELPDDDGSPGGVPGVDPVKAELVRREVAQRILDRSGDAGDVSARLASVGADRPDAEGGLHGHHPPRGAQGAARQHARAGTTAPTDGRIAVRRLRRVHHGVVSPASTQAGISDRHVQLDAGHATGESRRRTRRTHASARLQHRGRRRLLRCRRARCQKGVHRRAGGVVRWWRHGHWRRPALVHRAEERTDRSPRHGQRLPYAVAARRRRRFL